MHPMSGFLRCRRGNAATEFALLANLLVVMGFGTYDVANAIVTISRVTNAARSVAEIATTLAVQPDNQTNVLTFAQALSSASSVFGFLPDLRATVPPEYGVVLTSIAMTLASNDPTQALPKCPSSTCNYNAHVAWSIVLEGHLGTRRPCDGGESGPLALSAVSDAANPSADTLPTSMFQNKPSLVADVTYSFRPLFFLGVQSAFTMARSSYFNTRAGGPSDWVGLYGAVNNEDGTPNGPEPRCTGYPAPTTPPQLAAVYGNSPPPPPGGGNTNDGASAGDGLSSSNGADNPAGESDGATGAGGGAVGGGSLGAGGGLILPPGGNTASPNGSPTTGSPRTASTGAGTGGATSPLAGTTAPSGGSPQSAVVPPNVGGSGGTGAVGGAGQLPFILSPNSSDQLPITAGSGLSGTVDAFGPASVAVPFGGGLILPPTAGDIPLDPATVN